MRIHGYALVVTGVLLSLGTIDRALGQTASITRGTWYNEGWGGPPTSIHSLNDLTLHGKTDWVHYSSSFNVIRKANVAPQHIGSLTSSGNGTTMSFYSPFCQVNWSDGESPNVTENIGTAFENWSRDGQAGAGNNPYMEVVVSDLGASGKIVVWVYLFTSSTTTPTTAKLKATLSGTTPSEMTLSTSDQIGIESNLSANNNDQRIEIDYDGAQAGQTLTIRLEKTGGLEAGKIALSSIALTVDPQITATQSAWKKDNPQQPAHPPRCRRYVRVRQDRLGPLRFWTRSRSSTGRSTSSTTSVKISAPRAMPDNIPPLTCPHTG